MNYEKKYKNALAWAKAVYNGETGFARNEVEEVFPELKESEDERIRKGLIAIITDFDSLYLQENYSLSREDALTWLEKQGEHAKFRGSIQVGDKVTRNKDGILVNLSQLNRVAKKDEKQGEKKPILDVEIPFGAKDSELKEVTYDIPKGYHAEIDGNKVVIKKGEKKSIKIPKFKAEDFKEYMKGE